MHIYIKYIYICNIYHNRQQAQPSDGQKSGKQVESIYIYVYTCNICMLGGSSYLLSRL